MVAACSGVPVVASIIFPEKEPYTNKDLLGTKRNNFFSVPAVVSKLIINKKENKKTEKWRIVSVLINDGECMMYLPLVEEER